MKKLLTLAMLVSLSAAPALALTEQDAASMVSQIKTTAQEQYPVIKAFVENAVNDDFDGLEAALKKYADQIDLSMLAALYSTDIQNKINSILGQVGQFAQKYANTSDVNNAVTTVENGLKTLQGNKNTLVAMGDQINPKKYISTIVNVLRQIKADPRTAGLWEEIKPQLKTIKDSAESAFKKIEALDLEKVNTMVPLVLNYVRTGEFKNDDDLDNIIYGVAELKKALPALTTLANSVAQIPLMINDKVLKDTQLPQLPSEAQAALAQVKEALSTITVRLKSLNKQISTYVG